MNIRLFLFIVLSLFPYISAEGAVYDIKSDIAGEIKQHIVQKDETLYTIARLHNLGITEIMVANPGIDPWVPEEKTILTIPTAHILPDLPREGIVINLAELRLYYFENANTVYTFPIGIGKTGWQTPTGTTTIIRKRKDPIWTPPESIREENPDLPDYIPAGPNNPLGTHALNLGWSSYVIHGTNKPYGIGRRSSHGCIRLYPEDIPILFEKVDVGTKVTVIDKAAKAGWQESRMFLEISPEQSQTDEIMEHGTIQTPAKIDDIEAIVLNKALEGMRLYWHAVDQALEKRNGIPNFIGETSEPKPDHSYVAR